MMQVPANIIHTFLGAAAQAQDMPALTQDGVSCTYEALLRDVVSTAAHYREQGIRSSDRVLVFVPMSVDLYRIVLALFYIGASPVFLDEWVSLARLNACMEVVPCRGIVAGTTHLLLSRIIPTLRRIPIKLAVRKTGRPAAHFAPVEVGRNETALITFTTGSTGVPKAADRTHSFLHAQLEALDPLLRNVASPCLTTLPIVVLLHLARGRTTLLPPRRFRPKKPGTIARLGEAMLHSAPRSIIASPAIVDALIGWQDTSTKAGTAAAFARVRRVLTGGGPVYPDLAQRMTKVFPDAEITAVYGSTEAEPISHIAAASLAGADADAVLSSGLPVGTVDAAARVAILEMDISTEAIRDEAGLQQKLVARGLPGEVIVAGEHVLRHYISNPGAEAGTKIRIGETVWHRTGDCGRLDAGGRLYLLGRVAERIELSGRSLFPATITYALRIRTGIFSSALLLQGGRLLLILEKKDRGRHTRALAMLETLGVRPAETRFVGEIPKDPRHRSKVDYGSLRRMIGDA